MADHLFIWSDIPGDFFHASSGRDARGAAADDTGNTAEVQRVDLVLGLWGLLQGYIDKSRAFDLLEFHTHGAGGVVCLGGDQLTAVELQKVQLKGYDRALRPGATINLTGCNCAEGAFGELLLIQFARTLLRTGGGTVKGNTGAGIAVGGLLDLIWIDSGAVYHPFGHWVSAQATPGGAVSLFNHYHLDLDNINGRITRVEKSWSWLDADEQKDVRNELDEAKKFLPPLAPLEFWNLYGACFHLEKAEKILHDAIEFSPDGRYPAGF